MLSIIALKRGTGWLTAVEHSAGWENNNIGIYPGYMLDTFCQLGRSKMLGSILGEEELIKPQRENYGNLLSFKMLDLGSSEIMTLFKIYG